MQVGDTINGRYRVDSVHSTEGGMGSVLLIYDIKTNIGPLALKYCKEHTDEHQRRFRREARLMNEFVGNQKVVQLSDLSVEHDPPYIVMPFYVDGDLRTYSPTIETDFALQETIFLQMVDCINELHRKNIFHRDIKPQNFLRGSSGIVVSDFGLSMELLSPTLFTRSSQYWGTQGYIPPEFFNSGGFKNAKVESDIFMLGKSFYALATSRDPTFIDDSSLPKPLAAVINKCCQIDLNKRFHSIAELRQALVASYDVLLKRTDARSETEFLLDQILDQLDTSGHYDNEKVSKFLGQFVTLEVPEQWALVSKFKTGLFIIFADQAFSQQLIEFLDQYEEVVLSQAPGFSYAEVVANAMEVIFKRSQDAAARAKAFEITVKIATQMNRFAAMDTCVEMVTSVVSNDSVGTDLATIILQNPEYFLKNIEIVNLKNAEIKHAIASINKS